MATANLSELHQDEVKKFLRFFRTKRDLHLQALEADFEDTKSDRLIESMYTQNEVSDILGSLEHVVKDNVRTELAATVNMTVLLLHQMFEQADNSGVELEMDTGIIEDRSLLDEVEKLRLDAPSVARGGADKKAQRLTSLRDEHQKVVEEMERLQESNEQLLGRYQQMQQQCTKVLKEKTQLTEDLARAQAHLARAENEAASASKSAKESKEVADSSQRRQSGGETHILELKQQLDEARALLCERDEAAEAAVSRSKQFAQMRRMLSNKNEQLVDLRRRLQRYEPDDAKMMDDDDE